MDIRWEMLMFQTFVEFKKKHEVADSSVALLSYSHKYAQLFVSKMRFWLQKFEIQHLLLLNTFHWHGPVWNIYTLTLKNI